MNVIDYCNQIIFGKTLEKKLFCASAVDDFSQKDPVQIPEYPAREKHFDFSQRKLKFPRPGSLHIDKNKAIALHFFANHELLAIEMMAAAIVKFNQSVDAREFKKISLGILSSISDEQKHFKLYHNRFTELGLKFGDVPLNDFFWRQFDQLKGFKDFFSIMSLTFEAANLDFAYFYGNIFRSHGDEKTANIMDIIYRDELKHVKLGAHWLEYYSAPKSLWDTYLECLPEGISPARSKGISFDSSHRIKAGLPTEFIENLTNFDDNFRVTKRKR
tara:strand:+ start:178 stop:996 length:819 start_codon:yes stop_codon:yes gene_type:complete